MTPPLLTEALDSDGLGVKKRMEVQRSLREHGAPAFDLVATLVADEDEGRLARLCALSTALHGALGSVFTGSPLAPEAVTGETLPAKEPAPVAGLRALAALGLNLLRPAEEELRMALRWFDCAHVTVAEPSPPVMKRVKAEGRLGEILAWLTDVGAREFGSGPAAAAAVTVCELAGVLHRARLRPALQVLTHHGEEGRAWQLTGTFVRGGPVGLVPDPKQMTFFSADDGFGKALENAWANAGGKKIRGTVLWSLTPVREQAEQRDGSAEDRPGDVLRTDPLDWLQEGSLGAAFATLIDDVKRRARLVRGPFTLRRARRDTAIVGALDEDGELVSVSGYGRKLEAVPPESRVIVPFVDRAKAREHARDGLELDTARNWREAARKARSLDRAAVLRVWVAGGLSVALLGGLIGWYAVDRAHQADLREAAGRLAQKARDLGNSDPYGTGLLLAMASDDLAESAGKHTDVFGEVAQTSGTLVRLIRPRQGVFSDSAISEDGFYGLLATEAGSVSVVKMLDGSVAWSYDYPPGMDLSREQVFIEALAFAPDGRHAAFATSDREIVLLESVKGQWRSTRSIPMSVTSRPGPQGMEWNTAKTLAFSKDGKRLVAYGDRIGYFDYDLDKAGSERHCAPTDATKATAVRTVTGGAAILHGSAILRLDTTHCHTTRLLTAPAGVTFRDFIMSANAPTAVGTKGNDLLIVTKTRSKTLASAGPYDDVTVNPSDGQTWVDATTSSGSFGWEIVNNKQRFGFPGGVPTRSAGDHMIWMKNDLVAIHAADGNVPYTLLHSYVHRGIVSFLAWGGADLLVAVNNTVQVVSAPATGSSTRTSALPVPEGTTALRGLASAPNGRWAAGLVARKTGNTIVLWDLHSHRSLPVELPPGDQASSATFAGDRLYVGFRSGRLRAYSLRGGSWQTLREGRPTEDGITALRADGKELLALTALSANDPPTVVKVRASDLHATARRTLPGALGMGQVLPLPDGGIMVAYGQGRMVFLDNGLHVEGGLAQGSLGIISGLIQLPGTSQVAVTSQRSSVIIDTTSHSSVQTTAPWGRLGTIDKVAVTPDGKYFAAGNFLGAKLFVGYLRTEDRRQRACAAIGRDLTSDEWTLYAGRSVPYRKVCDVRS